MGVVIIMQGLFLVYKYIDLLLYTERDGCRKEAPKGSKKGPKTTRKGSKTDPTKGPPSRGPNDVKLEGQKWPFSIGFIRKNASSG